MDIHHDTIMKLFDELVNEIEFIKIKIKLKIVLDRYLTIAFLREHLKILLYNESVIPQSVVDPLVSMMNQCGIDTEQQIPAITNMMRKCTLEQDLSSSIYAIYKNKYLIIYNQLLELQSNFDNNKLIDSHKKYIELMNMIQSVDNRKRKKNMYQILEYYHDLAQINCRHETNIQFDKYLPRIYCTSPIIILGDVFNDIFSDKVFYVLTTNSNTINGFEPINGYVVDPNLIDVRECGSNGFYIYAYDNLGLACYNSNRTYIYQIRIPKYATVCVFPNIIRTDRLELIDNGSEIYTNEHLCLDMIRQYPPIEYQIKTL